jgi:hypothetical protein
MARGIFNTINKMALAAERASRQHARESARLKKEDERQARLREQRGQKDYHESRIAETDGANAQLAEQLEQPRTILICALDRDPSVNFERFLIRFPAD